MSDAVPDSESNSLSNSWQTLKEWPELILERLEGAGVARITLNRPDKRNCWNRPLCLAFLESLDIIRADRELKVVITKGAGSVYSSGLDLNFLREVSNGPLLDWDRPNLTIQIAEAVRVFPRIMIAQVHGYCVGGALGIMVPRPSTYAGLMMRDSRMRRRSCAAASAEHGHLHAPAWRAAGEEARPRRSRTGGLQPSPAPRPMRSASSARRCATAASWRNSPSGGSRARSPRATLAPAFEHHKDHRLQMGRDLSSRNGDPARSSAVRATGLRRAMDPLGDVESYLKSQKGGPNLVYKRPDV